jgi:hypothetical protein
MTWRRSSRRLAPSGIAGVLVLASLLVGSGTVKAGGTRVFISVGAPVVVRHPVARPFIVHRPFGHRRAVRPLAIHPVVPSPVIVGPSVRAVAPPSAVFAPPPTVVVVPKWVWTGSRWEWHTGRHVWIPEQWTWSGSRWIWTPGHWSR